MAAEQGKKTFMRHALLSTVSNYAGKVINMTTWFFLAPFILHQLGDNDYGLWALVGSVAAYGMLLDFGMADAVTKYVAEYRTTGQTEQAQSLVATALSLYTAIGLSFVLAAALFAPFITAIFNIAPAQQTTATWLVFLAGLGVGIAIPCATTSAVLRGMQRFDLLNIINGGSTLLQAALVVAVLLSGGGVLGLAVVTIVVRLLTQIPAVWIIYRIAPELRFGWRGTRLQSVRTVASFSWAVFILHLGGHLEAKTDEMVIGGFLPIRAVAPYSLAQKLSTVPQMITEQFLMLILPLASELHAAADFTRLRALYITSTRLTIAVFLPLACCLAILAGPLLGVWVGEAYITYAPLVVILVIASLLDTILWPAGFVLQGMARHQFPALVALGSGLVNVALSIFLVQRIGLIGVALGTLIPTTIAAFGLVLPYAMHILKVSLPVAVSQIFWPALLPGLPVVLITYYLREFYQPASFFSIGLIGGLGLLVYLGGYMLIGAGEVEWKIYHDVRLTGRRLMTKYFHRLENEQPL